MTGFDSKRTAALDKLAEVTEEMGLYAQPVQEPVAMRYDYDGYGYKYIDSGSGSDWQTRIKDAEPIYTTPPQRPWVELTDEEIQELRYKIDSTAHWTYDEFARYVEATLRSKNT